MDTLLQSQALQESLMNSQLLVDQLGDYKSFDRELLVSYPLSESFRFEQKLGHLYEDVLLALLKQSTAVEVLSNNTQVFKLLESGGRQTLGEMDYLVHTEEGTFQLELAVKFYLSVRQSDGSVYWPGPDARDNWDRKWRRMMSHQLPLSQSPAAKDVLYSMAIVPTTTSQHLLYGCLFDHIAEVQADAPWVSEHSHRGCWLKRSEWDELAPAGKLWHIPKQLWPVVPSPDVLELYQQTTKQTLMELSDSRCTMFTDGSERYFLVSEAWEEACGL